MKLNPQAIPSASFDSRYPNLGMMLSKAAALHPLRPAIILDNRVTSYEELDRTSTQLAGHLLHDGCRPGDRVAIHWCNSIEMVQLYFACFKAALAAVPVNIRLKAAEVAYVLRHSGAVLAFSQPGLAAVTEEADGESRSLRKIHTTLKLAGDAEAVPVPLPQPDGSDLSVIIYTSGSTAQPKGVMHSHQSLLNACESFRATEPAIPKTTLAMTQMSHASGLMGMLLSIANGSTLIPLPTFDAALALDLIERFHCGFAFCLPPQVEAILDEQARHPYRTGSLRILMAGGDAVPVPTQQRFRSQFGMPLREVYGLTEACLVLANPADAIRPGSLGTPLHGVEVRVVNAERQEVSDGQIGELAVRSPANFVGYWKDPGATNDLTSDGWFYTGDLGRRDAEGYYWFEGRKKHIIIRGGSNISPQEVENAICKHPAVKEVAVTGAPDRLLGERVLAFVSLRQGFALTESDLQQYVSRRLADYKVPETVIFLEQLPKGTTGKLDRKALKVMFSTALV